MIGGARDADHLRAGLPGELDRERADAARRGRHRNRVAGFKRYGMHCGIGRAARDRERSRDLPGTPAGFGVRFRASAITYSAWLARLSVKPITSSPTFTLPTPGPTLVTIPAKSEPSPEGNVAGQARVKQSLADLGLAGVDRGGLDLNERLALIRLEDQRVNDFEDVDAAVLVECTAFIAFSLEVRTPSRRDAQGGRFGLSTAATCPTSTAATTSRWRASKREEPCDR